MRFGWVAVAFAAAVALAACTSSSDDEGATPDAQPTIPFDLPTPTGGAGSESSDATAQPETPVPTTTSSTSEPAEMSSPSSSLAQARTVAVTSPAKGATVSGPVVVEVDVSGFSLTELTGHMSDDKGHLYAFVDEAPPPERIRLPMSQSIVTSADTSIELGDLEPGKHTVTIVATHAYPVPFEPRVEDTITFVVAD